MSRPSGPSLAVLILAAGAGCPPPSADTALVTDTGDESSGELAGSTTTTEAGSTTGTGAATDAATAGEGATTGEGPQPDVTPRIVTAKFSPQSVDKPGMVTLEVLTEHVEWVEAQLDGLPMTLPKDGEDRFAGEVAVSSELSDGTHKVRLRPFRKQDEGETVWREFTVDLAQGGTEAKWEAGAGLGEGLAGALIEGKEGELFEFGTLEPAGLSRCYLRRRYPDGTAGPEDFVEVQQGKHCTAIDTAVEPDGQLLLLSQVEELGVTSWRLDRHDPWNHTLATLLTGAPKTRGNAIAVGKGGEIVVCGSKPTEATDRDAAIWGFAPGFSEAFDLKYDDAQQDHWYTEEANDCVFVGQTLVIAGEAFGPHPGDQTDYKRHAVIEYDLHTKETLWTVAPAGQGTFVQSSAQAVASDGNGGYVTAGFICEEKCLPQLELRSHGLGGGLEHTYQATAKTTAPSAVAWHPAGYAVVTAAEIKGAWWSKMWAQAWIPGDADPLWTFSRSDVEGIHWALDVAIGKTGWVYLVGVVDIGGPLVPAFVILNP